MGAHVPKAFTVPTLADRWDCSEGLVRKMIERGELRSFRLGILIRVPADEVERIECQSQSHTASNDSEEGSPKSGGMKESGDALPSRPVIDRGRRPKRAATGSRAVMSRGQSAG